MEIDIKHACSFTGHRPERLDMRPNRVISWLEEEIRKVVDAARSRYLGGRDRIETQGRRKARKADRRMCLERHGGQMGEELARKI